MKIIHYEYFLANMNFDRERIYDLHFCDERWEIENEDGTYSMAVKKSMCGRAEIKSTSDDCQIDFDFIARQEGRNIIINMSITCPNIVLTNFLLVDYTRLYSDAPEDRELAFYVREKIGNGEWVNLAEEKFKEAFWDKDK